MKVRYEVHIRAGKLVMETRREDIPLEVLLDFASRQNPKRSFLFVSKILGKHIPCRPTQMRQVYDRLAERLHDLPRPVVVIGMAETATGLGAGVADSLARAVECGEVLYMHTTRHHLNRPLLVSFDENHSHAPEHILYAPWGREAEVFRRARSLVLVDDEISTGRTLGLLARQAANHMPQLQRITLATIVNWLDVDQRQALAWNLPQALQFESLLEGTFEFQLNPDYKPALPNHVNAHSRSRYAREDTGRIGLLMPGPIDLFATGPLPREPLVIVGTGEFTFAPFLAAERLEYLGCDVLFQSTTRSPIIEGDAILRKLAFFDEHGEGIANYIYNLPVDRQVVIAYEHAKMAMTHAFPPMVNAQVWVPR